MWYNVGSYESLTPRRREPSEVVVTGKGWFPMASTSIIPYSFENKEVRVVTGDDGEPRFVASDVCKALQIDNVSQTLSRLDDDEQGDLILNDAAGRPNKMRCVTESGLYSLTLSSRKPEAKRFKKWITSEVLPQIRKTGGYNICALSPLDQLKMTVVILERQEREVAELREKQAEQSQRIELIEARVDADEYGADFLTVLQYAQWKKIRVGHDAAMQIGRWAAQYSRRNNFTIGKVKQGSMFVNNYYREAVEYAFKRYHAQWPLEIEQ